MVLRSGKKGRGEMRYWGESHKDLAHVSDRELMKEAVAELRTLNTRIDKLVKAMTYPIWPSEQGCVYRQKTANTENGKDEESP
jgi:hypothetical protein